jgi:hypothetical protein
MGISKMLGKLFPPYEVKVTCRDINVLLQSDDGLCIDIVRREALKLAKDADKTLYSIRISGFKPDQLALVLIFNVLVRNLESGWYHTYRGVLGMQGQDMLRLWHNTAKEMIKRGYSTEEEYTVDLEGLNRGIRSAG